MRTSSQPFPLTLRNCCKNSVIRWLTHSYQVAEQHQAPFLNNQSERCLFSYLLHFTIGYRLLPAMATFNTSSNTIYVFYSIYILIYVCRQTPPLSKRWRGMWLGQSSEPCDGIYKLSLSPDGKLIAAIHYSSTLSIWHVPSMRLKRSWQLGLQVVSFFYVFCVPCSDSRLRSTTRGNYMIPRTHIDA